MAVLINSQIRTLVDEAKLIDGFTDECLEAATYDMRLGSQYVKSGRIRKLTDDSPTLVIQPGEFAILSSLERLNMPLNLVGHNGIPSKWAKRGLVSQFSPQIDPGFAGILTVPVYNAGDSPLSLTLRDRLFTVEFVQTTESVSTGWSESNGVQVGLDALNIPYATRPSLTDVTDVKERVEEMQVRLDESHAAMSTQVNQLDHAVSARLMELAADQKIIKGHLDALRREEEHRIGWLNIAIGVAALIVGLFAQPVVSSLWSAITQPSTPAHNPAGTPSAPSPSPLPSMPPSSTP